MAFHPYPQLIPSVFNLSGFGPPRGLTRASPWPWVDHSASGPEHTTTPHTIVWIRPIQTRFRCGYPTRVNLATCPRLAGSFFKRHAITPPRRRALTDCKRTVSGTISLPSRGTFHHSLTVLIRYRSLGSIQAYRVVPADSQQISRARCYSGTLFKADVRFSRTGLSPSTAGHPKPLPLTTTFSHYPPVR